MTYAGLTTADKPALLDAKAVGFKVFCETSNGGRVFYSKYPSVSEANSRIISIDIALAQIAEMESAEKPKEEMTIHGYSIRHLELIAILMRDHGVTPEDVKEAARNYSSGVMFAFTAANEQIQKGFKDAVERMGSPYTEGENK